MDERFAIELGDDGKGHEVDPVAACAHEPRTSRLVWAHFQGRSDETLDWLNDHGGLPQSVVYALTAVETRPRCEPIGTGALINLRGPAAEGEEGDPLVSVRIWVEQARVISVGLRRMAGFERIRAQMMDGKIVDPGDFVSHLAMLITKSVDPVISDLGDMVDDCETMLEPEHAYDTRRKIARARIDAIIYRRFIVPQREALTTLAGLDSDWLEADDRLHLREASDRFARMGEELETVRERAALIHEQLTDLRSEQIENRALILSVVALIFLPLTFLTGLLGMNVDGIPGSHDHSAFWEVTAICGVIALLLGAWFAKQHWFGK